MGKTIEDFVGDNWANLNVKQLLDDFIESWNNYGVIFLDRVMIL